MAFEGDLFSVLAADDSEERQSIRTATAMANKRVKDRFSAFLATDTEARFEYAKEDIEAVVTATADEYGVDPKPILAAILTSLTPKPQVPQRTAAVVEARKPKLCPYHHEVMDASLADGNPRAGFDAMAQHAFGPSHCKGSEYEGGKCNFRREFTSQDYWDQKAEQAEQRKQEREEQRQQEQEADPILPFEEPVAEEAPVEEPVAEETSDDTVVDVDFGTTEEVDGEPSAVGEGASEELAVAASTDDPFLHEATGLVDRPPAPRQFETGPDYLTRGHVLNQINQGRPGLTVNGEPFDGQRWQQGFQKLIDAGGREWGNVELGHEDPQVVDDLHNVFDQGTANLPDYRDRWNGIQDARRQGKSAADSYSDGNPWNTPSESPACPDCKGVGISSLNGRRCERCSGSGRLKGVGDSPGTRTADVWGDQGRAETFCQYCQGQGQFGGTTCPHCGGTGQANMPGGAPQHPALAHSERMAEALETVDIEKDTMPKFKKEIHDKTVPDTEMDGSPHPTKTVDPTEPIIPTDNDDGLAETDAVLEKQDVEKSEGPPKGGEGGTFPKGNGANPVTSAADVNTNPVREILLEDEDGFLDDSEVVAAIRQR